MDTDWAAFHREPTLYNTLTTPLSLQTVHPVVNHYWILLKHGCHCLVRRPMFPSVFLWPLSHPLQRFLTQSSTSHQKQFHSLAMVQCTYSFLGATVYIQQGAKQARESLMGKLTSLLQKVDNSLVTRQQKLKLFKLAI